MVAFLIILCHFAIAEEPDLAEAKVLYENGKILFEEGRYENAIDSWQRSYQISQKSILLYNIALAYEEMEDYDQAIDFINKYRSFAAPEERVFLKEKLLELEEKKSVKEHSTAPQAPVPVETQAPAPASEAPEVTPDVPPASVGEPEPPSTRPMAVYGAWGATLALVGTSTTLGLLKNQTAEEYTATHGCINDNGELLCPTSAESISGITDTLLREEQLAMATNISWGVSLAAAGLSTWLTVKQLSTAQESSTALWLSNNMIGIKGTF